MLLLAPVIAVISTSRESSEASESWRIFCNGASSCWSLDEEAEEELEEEEDVEEDGCDDDDNEDVDDKDDDDDEEPLPLLPFSS